jgi:hypothetical protein
MDKEYLARLDRAEKRRVDEILDEMGRSNTVELPRLLRNDTVVEVVLTEGKALMDGYDANVLPTSTLFYKRFLLGICPSCQCARKPELLRPFLERDLVVPMLSSSYEHYPVAFADEILRYPHMSSHEFNSFRQLSLEIQEGKWVCPDCTDEIFKRTKSLLGRFRPKSQKRLLKALVISVLRDLVPVLPPEQVLVNELNDCLKKQEEAKLPRILSLIACSGAFRSAQAFSAIPQVSMNDFGYLEKRIKENQRLSSQLDMPEIRESVMQGLRLSYNPSLPIETYLDIVVPRRDKVQNLVSGIVKKSQPASNAFLSNLQNEIEKVNSEVRTLRSSKKTKLFGLVTNFVTHNKSLVTGCLIAATLGLGGLAVIGCGSGVAAGIGSKILQKYQQVYLPKEGKELKEELLRWVEPGYERFLSHLLSRSANVVQVWQLQEKLVSGQL